MPPTTWASSPAVWVDLNAPAPLIGLTNATTGEQAIAYPILDVRNFSGSGTITPEGFALTNASGALPPGATALQPAPMPVQWLYVLQNGEVIPADSGGNGVSVTFTHASVQPSSSDPIVGRIAFWTDDDTCKINVNTAGGDGINNSANNATNTANLTFWDTPYFISTEDNNLGYYQPAANEFQRYPGHPATTALRDVLNSLGFTSLTSANFYGLQAGGGYGVTPRYAFGGSEGATIEGTNITTGISTRSDRLYPTVGEMLFNPDHSASFLNSGVVQQMEPGKFFLTANSKAPEVNLYGQPRISMWPISAANDGNHRTATDQLLAFASTAGGLPYYFTRSDPSNTTNDIGIPRNAALLNYLDRLTKSTIPGFGGNFDEKYPPSSATGTSISERQQILTEIFDYIRTTNIHDSTVNNPYAAPSPSINVVQEGEGQVVPSVNATWNTQGLGRMYRINEISLLFTAMGNGATSGAVNVNGINPLPWSTNATTFISSGPGSPGTLSPGWTAIRAFLVCSIYDPGMGFSEIVPDTYLNVDGLDKFTVTDATLTNQFLGFLPASQITPIPLIGPGAGGFQGYSGGSDLGGLMDLRCMVGGHWLTYNPSGDVVAGQDGHRFPFYSSIVAVTNGAPLTVSGGTVTLYVAQPPNNPLVNAWQPYPTTGIPSPVIQKYTVVFPSMTIPVPTVNAGTFQSSPNTGVTNLVPFPSPPIIGATQGYPNTNSAPFDRWSFNFGMVSTQPNTIIGSGDVVRSIVPASGDVRMLALNSVPASAYSTIANYGTLTNMAHGYSTPGGQRFYGAQESALVTNAVYSAYIWPNVVLPTTGAQTTSGAWGPTGTTV